MLHALDIVKKVYSFSDLEKEAAPLLYQSIRPLWWYASDELKEAGTDEAKIQKHLDGIEYEQTRKIDFQRTCSFRRKEGEIKCYLLCGTEKPNGMNIISSRAGQIFR